MLRWDSVSNVLSILFLIAVLAFFFVSCATHRDVAELHENLNALSTVTESRLSALGESIASLDSLVKEQYTLSMNIQALIGSQAREQRDDLSRITARQDDINYQLRELRNKLQAIQLYGGIEARKPQDQSTSASEESISKMLLPSEEKTLIVKNLSATIDVKPEELYKSAIDDINQGTYVLAESRLLTFLIQFPEHELAGNAQYLLGKISYDQQKYELAINEFDKLIKRYSKSPQIPSALLMKGLAQVEIGNNKSASSSLKTLINSYPKSEEAKEAREKLKSM